MSTFGKKSRFGKSRFGKSRFGKSRFGAYEDDYINDLIIDNEKENLLPKIEKEIEIAEKIIKLYPKNDTLKRRAIRLLNSVKRKFVQIATVENATKFINITITTLEILTTLLVVMIGMKEAYVGIYTASSTFRNLASLFEKLLKLFKRKNNDVNNDFIKWVKYTGINGDVYYIDPEKLPK